MYRSILLSIPLFILLQHSARAQSVTFDPHELTQFMDGKYLFHDTVSDENNLSYLRYGPIEMFSLPSVFSVAFDSANNASMAVWVYKGSTTVPDIMVDGKDRPSATLAEYNAIKKKIENIHGEATTDDSKKSKAAMWNYSNSSMALTYEDKGIGLVIMHKDADHAPLSSQDFKLDYKFITETK